MSWFYDNIPDISRVFHEFNNPVWSLYSGRGKTTYPTNNANLLYQQPDPNLHMSESWDMLNRQLSFVTNRGGYGHIYQGTKEDFINIPIYFPHVSEQGAGAGGMYPAGVAGMYPVGVAGIAQALEKERQIWDLQREVEDIRNQQTGSFTDRLLESLFSSEQFPAILSGVVGVLAKAGGGAVNGPPAIQLPDRVGDETNQGEGSDFRSRIRKHFSSNQEMEGYLQKAADLFDIDAEGMKQLLNQATKTGKR